MPWISTIAQVPGGEPAGRASGESPRAAQAYTATAVQKLIKLVTCQILSHLVTFVTVKPC